jgi:hypothetical protein
LSIPIVCTEIGQHSDYARGSSDEAQSRYVVKTFAWAMAAGLQHAEWFAIRDITDGYPFLYGLLDSSWQRKRSFYAFRTIAQQLGRAVYVRTMTSGELGSPQAEGYVFQDAAEVVYVMWMNDEVTRTVQLAGSSALMVDKYGVQSSINAGTGSFVLQVKIGPSPAFVRPVP